jgi:hypothetical protein
VELLSSLQGQSQVEQERLSLSSLPRPLGEGGFAFVLKAVRFQIARKDPRLSWDSPPATVGLVNETGHLHGQPLLVPQEEVTRGGSLVITFTLSQRPSAAASEASGTKPPKSHLARPLKETPCLPPSEVTSSPPRGRPEAVQPICP